MVMAGRCERPTPMVTLFSVGYDGDGRKVFDVDVIGQKTEYGYDNLGRMVSVICRKKCMIRSAEDRMFIL